MAGTAKKSTKPAAKATETAEVKAIEPKTEEIKTEETAQPKATVTRKTSAKKAAPKAAAKEETAKETKASVKKTTAKKAAEKCSLQIQYGGRSYSQEDLIKIAKDVWKYDLKHKAGELSSIELYVKPEENKVYYVMNGEAGSFDI